MLTYCSVLWVSAREALAVSRSQTLTGGIPRRAERDYASQRRSPRVARQRAAAVAAAAAAAEAAAEAVRQSGAPSAAVAAAVQTFSARRTKLADRMAVLTSNRCDMEWRNVWGGGHACISSAPGGGLIDGHLTFRGRDMQEGDRSVQRAHVIQLLAPCASVRVAHAVSFKPSSTSSSR